MRRSLNHIVLKSSLDLDLIIDLHDVEAAAEQDGWTLGPEAEAFLSGSGA